MTQETDVQIILPAVSDDEVTQGLVQITQILVNYLGIDNPGGGLGGMFGYGAEFSNDIFEMYPFWWGDCECSFGKEEAIWYENHEHAKDCYQIALDKIDGNTLDKSEALAKEWGLSLVGCAVHCTCNFDAEYEAWSQEHDHDATCGLVRPNFLHKASNSQVRWYKYIGRSMQIGLTADWPMILNECLESLV